MKLAVFTNTYLPHVGGVANSVGALVEGMRERGHRCLVIAPDFPDQPEEEKDVIRIPSIRNFNGTDFSYRLPSGNRIGEAIKDFQPDIIHSHHPFLLGDAAMRMANQWSVPLVFTHHTRYEDYVHYVLEDSDYLERLAIELASEYANLCDRVIAPSGSIAGLIRERGVKTPVSVIPTGIDTKTFTSGSSTEARKQLGIPAGAFVIGHVGRLAEEKNLTFLVEAACHFLRENADAVFLLVGSGDLEEAIAETVEEAGLTDRVHRAGKLKGEALVDAYRAMDVFIFSSKSETQGMVLAEAMAAGVPVAALDASGVRDIVEDGSNGRLLEDDIGPEGFARGIGDVRNWLQDRPEALQKALAETARAFSSEVCMDALDSLYGKLHREMGGKRSASGWDRFINRVEAEWEITIGRARAVGAAFKTGG
ncbi:MAG: glycosyltransferase [Oceanipulchritudo sp.]